MYKDSIGLSKAVIGTYKANILSKDCTSRKQQKNQQQLLQQHMSWSKAHMGYNVSRISQKYVKSCHDSKIKSEEKLDTGHNIFFLFHI